MKKKKKKKKQQQQQKSLTLELKMVLKVGTHYGSQSERT